LDAVDIARVVKLWMGAERALGRNYFRVRSQREKSEICGTGTLACA